MKSAQAIINLLKSTTLIITEIVESSYTIVGRLMDLIKVNSKRLRTLIK